MSKPHLHPPVHNARLAPAACLVAAFVLLSACDRKPPPNANVDIKSKQTQDSLMKQMDKIADEAQKKKGGEAPASPAAATTPTPAPAPAAPAATPAPPGSPTPPAPK